MDELEDYSLGREKKSCCVPAQAMLFGCGENFKMIASMKEQARVSTGLTAPSSETSQAFNRRSLSDRLAKSLLSAGLIAGITPMLTRRVLGADCREGVLLRLDGDMSESEAGEQEPKAENSF